jgi:predicted RND superfamily exporter protein
MASSEATDSLTAARGLPPFIYCGFWLPAFDAVEAVHLLIDIGVIRELAISASMGMAVIILTNPNSAASVMISYVIGREGGEDPVVKRAEKDHPFWRFISNCASDGSSDFRGGSVTALAQGVFGTDRTWIGDLDQGAPELHPDSRCQPGQRFRHPQYSTSSDVLVIMVKTASGCSALTRHCQPWIDVEDGNTGRCSSTISMDFRVRGSH